MYNQVNPKLKHPSLHVYIIFLSFLQFYTVHFFFVKLYMCFLSFVFASPETCPLVMDVLL